MNLEYESLKDKLVLPFVLLGYVVSAALSLITFALVAELEEQAIAQHLNVELERFRYQRAVSPHAETISDSLVLVLELPTTQLPSLPKHAPGYQGIERVMTADKNFTVLIGDVGKQPYALAYDRELVDARLARLALFLLIGTAGMTFLSHLIGSRLAQGLARPLRVLLHDIDQQAQQAHLSVEAPPLPFQTTDFPNNEIGALARSLENYAHRLQGFIARESYFAADVSHELRTPIAAILGAAEVMQVQPDLPEKLRARIALIHRNAVRAGEVLEAMLVLAREKTSPQDLGCDVAEVATELAEDMRDLLRGHPVEMQLLILARPQLQAHRSLVYVAISNLLRNASAHTRSGHITIRLESDHLSVTDTGVGIPAERFDTIFRRLEKGANSQGFGLGLSIVARITEYLDWRITVTSTEGQGTQICLHFQH